MNYKRQEIDAKNSKKIIRTAVKLLQNCGNKNMKDNNKIRD